MTFRKKRALFYDKNNQYELSETDWAFILLDSSNTVQAVWHTERSRLYANFEKRAIALQHVKRAIEYNPNYAEAYATQAGLDTANSQTLLDKALTLTTDSTNKAKFWDKKGDYYAKSKQYDDAIKAYNVALDLVTIKSFIREKLADVYLKMRQKDQSAQQIALASKEKQQQIEEQLQKQRGEMKTNPTVSKVPFDNYWWLKNTGTIADNNQIKLKIGADAKVAEAWQLLDGYGNPNIKIAVNDGGFDLENPELKKNCSRRSLGLLE